jgi:hypothetical protein
VIVEMRVSGPAGPAQLFWTTASLPGTSEAASEHAETIADAAWHDYVFPVARNWAWSGCITSLRFDPATKKDVTIEIRSIRLE